MPLSAGERLGPYEIIAQVGAGGMGVVYRARDSRVGRDVAIKVSNERFTDRFDSEARAVAALNHANVCTLHDVGPDYLVMEFVDGEPPAGPLPLATVLGYARQIASALDAAHEKGIVHRDLKPANIRIRPDGTVKVLDFGLAKIGSPGTPSYDVANSPTMSVSGTQVGTLLGTAAYMAPEQARGLPVDKRADIWAFGAVCYELLTGRRAFEGEDVTSIIAAIIGSEPRWDGVPPSVRPLIQSCLEKDPRNRLRDIGDVGKLLDASRAPLAPAAAAGRAGWIAAAALVVVAATALWAPWRPAPVVVTQPTVRLDVELGREVSILPFSEPTFSSLIISPDGTRVVFIGRADGGSRRLFVKRLDEPVVREIPGTQEARDPFFSPDGEWVGFFNGFRVSKVPIDGGAVVSLTDVNVMSGAAWATDGSILAGSGVPGTAGLVRIPAAGGPPIPIAKLASDELYFTFPQLLPGEKAVVLTVVRGSASLAATNIEVVRLEDGHRQPLLQAATSPRYLPSGHLVYAAEAGMFAVPFDIDRLEIKGTAVPINPDAAFDPVTGGAQFDVSRDGTLVYRKKTGDGSRAPTFVQWLDRSGKLSPLFGKSAFYGMPRLSPDGSRVAIVIRDGTSDAIWVYDIERTSMTRLTSVDGTFSNPVWTRDGQFVIFGALGLGMHWARADGSVKPQVLIPTRSLQMPSSVSPDGTRLAFEQIDGKPQIWFVDLKPSGGQLTVGTPARFMTSEYSDRGAVVSPDGQWVAYESNESGHFEVYVRPFSSPAIEGKVLISSGGGNWPAWLPTGGELLYASGGNVMTAGYTADAGKFVAQKPRQWANATTSGPFEIARDGKRLVVVTRATPADKPGPQRTFVFVRNFFDELRRLAPR